MTKFISIGEAAKVLGVATVTPSRWEASGKLVAQRTAGGQRRYDLGALRQSCSMAPRNAQDHRLHLGIEP